MFFHYSFFLNLLKYLMIETSALYLFVLLAIVDSEVHEKERKLLNQVIEELDPSFDLDNSIDQINNKFRDDFDSALEFYMKNITDKDFQIKAIEFMKELAMSDKKLHDKEISFLEKCNKIWSK